MKKKLLTVILLTVALSVQAQPGSLDLSFGQGGKVRTNIDQTRNVTNQVLVQKDGKIVQIGYCMPVDYTGYFTLVRYNKDGSLDNTFGDNGIVTTAFGVDEDIPFSGVIQPDGKIIAAGYTWDGSDYDFAMIRYNSNGTRDITFGVSGIVTTDFGGNHDKANQVLLEPDGDIILAGHTNENNDIDMAVARYKSNGQADVTFGIGGKVVVQMGDAGLWQAVRGAALQGDGKLVLAGYIETYEPVTQSLDREVAVIRLAGNGAMDNDFGNGGITTLAIGQHAIATSVVLQSNNQIVILAETKVLKFETADFALVRFNQNGTVDGTFGTNGVVKTAFDNSDDIGNALILQPDQKILAAGFTAKNNGSTVDFAVARYLPDGSLDNSFGTGGKVTADFLGKFDFGTAIALHENGKVVLGGFVGVGDDYDFGLVRLNNDTALPVTLTSFEARDVENQVELNWVTAGETNSLLFQIERSADGRNWSSIGFIAAQGESQAENIYRYTDREPLAGRSFYRLKMLDTDQTYSYSQICSIHPRMHLTHLVVYPNPASIEVHIAGESVDTAENVFFINEKGQRLFPTRISSDAYDLSNLTKGVYNLSIPLKGSARTIQKLIVK